MRWAISNPISKLVYTYAVIMNAAHCHYDQIIEFFRPSFLLCMSVLHLQRFTTLYNDGRNWQVNSQLYTLLPSLSPDSICVFHIERCQDVSNKIPSCWKPKYSILNVIRWFQFQSARSKGLCFNCGSFGQFLMCMCVRAPKKVLKINLTNQLK